MKLIFAIVALAVSPVASRAAPAPKPAAPSVAELQAHVAQLQSQVAYLTHLSDAEKTQRDYQADIVAKMSAAEAMCEDARAPAAAR